LLLQVKPAELKAALESGGSFVWELSLPTNPEGDLHNVLVFLLESLWSTESEVYKHCACATLASYTDCLLISGALKGFGFATFMTRGHAESAIKTTNGQVSLCFTAGCICSSNTHIAQVAASCH